MLTYLVGFLGDGILQAALSIVGMFGGPTLGLFMMGKRIQIRQRIHIRQINFKG